MERQKVCWKITTRCNQNCKYCFGFSNIGELDYDKNGKVLEHLANNGVTDITWTGGEAILYPQLNKLLKKAKENGIYNKLVTNGIYLSQNDNEYTKDIIDNLDCINLSIDSISNDINLELGKENNHFELIKQLLEKIKDKNVKIAINTVVSKKNIDKLEELGEFLNNYKIDDWKFLKFMPVRERALMNKEEFEITEEQLEKKVNSLRKYENIKNVRYKKQKSFEKSIVILPNADIIITENGIDRCLGNALEQEKFNLKGSSPTDKVRILVTYDNEKIAEDIVNMIKKIDYTEIVGVCTNEQDTLDKIIKLKPEMVFAKYETDGINGLEIAKKAGETLGKWKMPIFNILDSKNEITEKNADQLSDIVKTVGSKLNSLIREPYNDRIPDIIKDYKENKY